MDFVAIDFETATRRSDSPCQLAAVVVRGWEIVDQRCWLIRPRPFSFDPRNVAIHGITATDVESAPEFDQVWKEGRDLIAGDIIVAHNARFDLHVLRATLQCFRMPVPEMGYACTRLIARRSWPGRPGYGLKPTAAALGIEFRHHDALEDARACAKIMIAAGRLSQAQDVSDLEWRLGIRRGRAAFWGLDGPSTIRTPSPVSGCSSGAPRQQRLRGSKPRRSFRTPDSITTLPMAPRLAAAVQNPCWQGKRIVFTGRLRQLSRSDAERIARALGGQIQSSVTKKTSVLVVGEIDERTRAAGRQMSTKQERAEQLRCDGAPIELVDEPRFLQLTAGNADRFVAASRSAAAADRAAAE